MNIEEIVWLFDRILDWLDELKYSGPIYLKSDIGTVRGAVEELKKKVCEALKEANNGH